MIYKGYTVLMISCRKGIDVLCQVAIDAGADVDIQDNSGKTALLHAARDGFQPICKMLIRANADLNIQDKNMRTALMEASIEGYVDICKDLTQAGADLNIPDKNGKLAADLASDDPQLKEYMWTETYWRRKKGFVMFLYMCGFRSLRFEANTGEHSRRGIESNEDCNEAKYRCLYNNDLCRMIMTWL